VTTLTEFFSESTGLHFAPLPWRKVFSVKEYGSYVFSRDQWIAGCFLFIPNLRCGAAEILGVSSCQYFWIGHSQSHSVS
jgi:hypothetical protein